ncbi:uncharacterized protein LOC105829299 isoform X2 [Monomorium pharaonis]|uniref:uncharacterized protein LOC105829299 isoform X2 n=1 Tax=Monomorium pharaonis TaxID=307658 RepID=UPI00063F393F|nr:uncharacterized protein LOC105829299 isoform X2 [Monomorium pharaonis]
MSCDAESVMHSLFKNEEVLEKSVVEVVDSRSNISLIQTVISQKHSKHVTIKYDNISTSTDKDENYHLSVPTVGNVETEENEDDKIISIIDKKMRNNSKEKKYICCGKLSYLEVLNQVFKSQDSSENSNRSRSKKVTLSLLDTFISTSIVAPLTIGFWRGVWTSMDHHSELFPSWFCFIFGAALHIAYTVFKDQLHNVYVKKWAKSSWRKRLSYRMLRILYTYTFGVACIAHWRGGWIIIDNYLFMHMWIMMSLTCSLLMCLAILRSVRNLIATPLIIFIDTPSYIFQFPTRYNMIFLPAC